MGDPVPGIPSSGDIENNFAPSDPAKWTGDRRAVKTFGRFTTLEPKTEHIDAVLAILADGELYRVVDIAERSGLTQTQTGCALDRLEDQGRIQVERRSTPPKIRVRLASGRRDVDAAT